MMLPADTSNTSLWRPRRAFAPLLPDRRPLAAGCSRVYIDLGCNDGLNLRRLFMPAVHRYGQSLFRELDAAVAGGQSNRSDICAIGFEPVPANEESIRKLVASLRAGGQARAQLLAVFPAAVHATNGLATFYLDQNGPGSGGAKYHNWGSSLLMWEAGMERRPLRVPQVGLTYLLERLHGADADAEAARVLTVMKMDIEGAEYDALPAAWRAVCARVDRLFLETHDRFFSERWHGHRAEMGSGEGRVGRLHELLGRMDDERRAGRCRTRWTLLGAREGRRAR